LKYAVAIIFSCLLSFPSQALNSFESHVLSVSQGMSAFYMYLLTEGDEKYIQQFDRYQLAAEAALNNVDISQYSELNKNWQEFVSKLEYRVLKDQSIFFETHTRNKYRNYLTNLYLKFQESTPPTVISKKMAFNRVQILSSILAARALDVASDIYGSTVLTNDDNKLDPKKIANQIQLDIDYLLNQKLGALQRSMLRKVRSKFHFIKNTMVDYKTQTAYFLIYGNMTAMNKLFNRKANKAFANNSQ